MKILLSAIIISIAISGMAQTNYKIIKTFHIASAGGWDYLAVNRDRLYVSHGTQVNILDKNSGDSLGVIENTTGIHGIAFNNSLNIGYTSNGRLNNVSVFNLKTNEVTEQIATGENPDAILYDEFSKKVFTCNGRSNDLTVIDAATNKVIATIPVGGKPETAVSDNAGKLYVNVEDKSQIAEVNTQTMQVLNHWSIAPGAEPTGLAFDTKTKRLFAACDKMLVVINTANGKVVTTLPIGEGCDGVAFDAVNKNIFTSNGRGTMTIIHEDGPDTYKVLDNVPTKPRARTIALDEKTHKLYLPTAEFEPVAPDANKNERPKMIPGTFQVLVMGKK